MKKEDSWRTVQVKAELSKNCKDCSWKIQGIALTGNAIVVYMVDD